MQAITSAVPVALRNYGLAGEAAGARLGAETDRLDAALAELSRRCSAYPLPRTHGLDRRLWQASRELTGLAAWVAGVGTAFRAADGDAGVGVRLEPPPAPPRPEVARHAATVVRSVEAAIALFQGHHGPGLTALLRLVPLDELRPALLPSLRSLADAAGAARLRAAFAVLNAATGPLRNVLDAEGPDAVALVVFTSLWELKPRLPGEALVRSRSPRQLLWNGLGETLLGLLALVEARGDTNSLLRALMGTDAALVAVLAATLGGVVGASVGGDVQHWATQPLLEDDDLLDLWQRSFWNQSMAHMDPELFVRLAREIDALILRLWGDSEAEIDPATPCSDPSNVAPGAYRAISYAPGEQLVLERLNGHGDYRLSIAGLDPNKAGVPNNFAAVALAAYYSPAQNHYYAHVRERLFAALRELPPGSKLHLQGHSLGGAMCLMLWNDPEVRRRLQEAGVTVPSLTTYGAVIPTHVQLAPPLPAGDPFATTSFRAFVHRSDSLAHNVGAGYDGFAGVQQIGGPFVEAPIHAHSDYASADNYAELPAGSLALPYTIDLEHYRRTVPVAAAEPFVPVAPPPPPAAFA